MDFHVSLSIYMYHYILYVLHNAGRRHVTVAKSQTRMESLTLQSAILSPILASASLFGLYTIIKNYEFDIALAYQVMVEVHGHVCIY